QVASAIAHGWLDDVYTGLEAQGYAVGSAVLPACGVGAPHRRDRLWFVAHAQEANGNRYVGGTQHQGGARLADSGNDGDVDDTQQPGLEGYPGNGDNREQPGRDPAGTQRPVAEA